MEALVRWQHPARGLLAPGAFIAFAEANGLIDEVGDYVLATACDEARRWTAGSTGTTAPAVSVNLSPIQLMNAGLPRRVESLLDATALPPERLILEITEGALMRDPLAAIERLRRLSDLGVRLAIDDFGTGYSSLSALQQLPIDLLKIDGGCIDDTLSSSGWSLAQAIVQIAHGFGFTPIAEGVETQVQVEALVSVGCNFAQGFHLGRPLDATATRTLLESDRPSPIPGAE